MKLHELRPAPGARRSARRVGRGTGSGRGKTAGRGEKGQKSRRGYSHKRGFEGGQMPLHRRLPKRGFTNIFRVVYSEVNVSRIADLPAGTEVNPEFLQEKGLATHKGRPVKILGNGEIQVALKVKAHRFSQAAARKIQEAGGTVEVIEARRRGPKPRVKKAGRTPAAARVDEQDGSGPESAGAEPDPAPTGDRE